MVASNPCNPQRLRRLLREELSRGEQNAITTHLESCIDCQHRLESMAADETWWSEARRWLQSELHDSSQEAGSGCLESAAESGPELYSEVLRGFLEPTEQPGLLGQLGGYPVAQVIGRGGTGIVLKAHDPELHRYVAIKVLTPELASSGAARRRFTREAQAAAAVVHPHVVPIYAVNATARLPYLVMQYVPGQSLQDRLQQQGPLDLKETLRIGMQVARGLAAAHAQGLVHRDVKPANILLEKDVGRALITDFGLARAADDASLTCSGLIAGTPQFMSPEQARGEAVDYRSDLFSLASVLYAMCTGHPPFRAESALAVVRRVAASSPRPIAETAPEIPLWFSLFLAKLHSGDPRQRWSSSAEVAELLEKCLAHVQQPAKLPLPAPLEQLQRSAVRKQRSRGASKWVGIVSAGVLSLAVACMFSLQTRPNSVPGEAETQQPPPASEQGFAGPSATDPTGSPADEPVDRALAEIEGQLNVLESELFSTANDAPLLEDLP